MSTNDINETESPAIIEEIIPGKNNDSNNKNINRNNNNNQQSLIENYNEQEAAKAVSEATVKSIKTLEGNSIKSTNQIPSFAQVIIDTQEQTSLVTRIITENYLEFQKQAIVSFQSALIPYFLNVQNQLWSNSDYFKNASELYHKFFKNYTEGMIAFSRIFNEVSSSNMNYLKSAFDSLSVNRSRGSNLKVDDGRNSDENSINVKATFSCETCGQTFNSRQALKEHASTTHYHAS